MKYCMQAEMRRLEWDRDHQEARLGKDCVTCTACPWPGGSAEHPAAAQPRQAAAGAAELSLTPPQSALLEPWNGFSISQTVSYQMTESIFKEVFASLHFV